MIRWPKRPVLSEEDFAELERLGAEKVRRLLAQRPWGSRLHVTHGPYDQAACVWLDWKAARAAMWNKTAVLLALMAAIASVVAAVEGWLALPPLPPK